MEWTDIDFEQALWTLVAKGGRQHVIPLSGEAVRVIESLRPLSGHKPAVFLGPTGDAIANPGKSIIRLRKRSKVEFRIHDIRRTVATGLAQIGVRTDVVSAVLGHTISGPQATRAYERHGRIPEMRTALERWAAHIQRIITSKEASVIAFER
jgi:integrase